MNAMHDYPFLGSSDREVSRFVVFWRVMVDAKAQVKKLVAADQQRLRKLVGNVAALHLVRLTPNEESILVRILERHTLHRPVNP